MSDVRVCVFDAGTLTPVHASEPFTMHTVIGAPSRSWLAHWRCETCGLLYSPSIMPDPREVERAERLEREEQAERARIRLEASGIRAVRLNGLTRGS